jgi:hypothetical protein
MAKEDCVTELDRVTAEKLDVFREECEVEEQAVCDRVDQKANIVYDTMSEKIDAYVDHKMDFLKRERGWLGWEREVFEREKRRFENAMNNGRSERGARAGSAPP